MMKNRVCDSANPLPLAADVVKKLDAENATLRAERDALAERVRGLEAFIDKVFVHWSFDNDQQHTHTWHTREDLRAEYAALTPPAPQQECALCRGVGRANRCDGDTSVPVDCPKCVTPPAPAKAAREGEAQA